jgi:hypothetical protein
MRENKLTAPPAAFGRRSDSSKAGKGSLQWKTLRQHQTHSRPNSHNAKAKSVESDNPAYIAVLQAEIERKRSSSSIGRTKPKPPKTPAKTGDHHIIADLPALTRLRSSCRPCSLIHLLSLPIMSTWTGIFPPVCLRGWSSFPPL